MYLLMWPSWTQNKTAAALQDLPHSFGAWKKKTFRKKEKLWDVYWQQQTSAVTMVTKGQRSATYKLNQTQREWCVN